LALEGQYELEEEASDAATFFEQLDIPLKIIKEVYGSVKWLAKFEQHFPNFKVHTMWNQVKLVTAKKLLLVKGDHTKSMHPVVGVNITVKHTEKINNRYWERL
jgi:hypothetical protein